MLRVISTIDNFLDKDDLELYLSLVSKSKSSQTIIEDATITDNFWMKYQSKLKDHHLDLVGIYPKITITNSKKPVIRHMDLKFEDERFKILIYLNEVPNGGTIFYDDNPVLVDNKENRLVLFDITLHHQSHKFDTEIKKMAIGFRVY